MQQTRRKKILIASPVANTPALSGNSTRIHDIVKLMKQVGFDVSFCLIAFTPIASRLKKEVMDAYWTNRITYINEDLKFKGSTTVKLLRLVKKILHKIKRYYSA